MSTATATPEYRTTDERVRGVAQAGDVVHYSDQANQPGAFSEVVEVGAHQLPVIGFDGVLSWVDGSPEYTLRDLVTGRTSTSDLRQHGWVHATPASAAV